METDADRLSMIQGLGGIEVRFGADKLWMLFDPPETEQGFDNRRVIGREVTATARTSDVKRTGLSRASVVMVDFVDHDVVALTDDGSGMTTIELREI